MSALTSYLELCRPFTLASDWAGVDADPWAYVGPADPEIVFHELLVRHPESELLACGLAVHDDQGRLQLHPFLVAPEVPVLALVDPTRDAVSDLLTDRGCLRSRDWPMFAILEDKHTQSALDKLPDSQEIYLTAGLRDTITLRSLGMPAAPVVGVPDFGQRELIRLEEVYQVEHRSSAEIESDETESDETEIDEIESVKTDTEETNSTESKSAHGADRDDGREDGRSLAPESPESSDTPSAGGAVSPPDVLQFDAAKSACPANQGPESRSVPLNIPRKPAATKRRKPPLLVLVPWSPAACSLAEPTAIRTSVDYLLALGQFRDLDTERFFVWRPSPAAWQNFNFAMTRKQVQWVIDALHDSVAHDTRELGAPETDSTDGTLDLAASVVQLDLATRGDPVFGLNPTAIKAAAQAHRRAIQQHILVPLYASIQSTVDPYRRVLLHQYALLYELFQEKAQVVRQDLQQRIAASRGNDPLADLLALVAQIAKLAKELKPCSTPTIALFSIPRTPALPTFPHCGPSALLQKK